MSTPDLFRAAAERLRAENTPLHTAVAGWLDSTAQDAGIRIGVWELTEQDVAGLTEYHYRWALAVARSVLAEVAS